MIANSLSITIAQRTREFATLRTLGALAPPGARLDRDRGARRRRARVGRSASSSASGSRRASSGSSTRVGFTLPNSGLLFETRTIVVSLLVGILVTLLASLRPASGRRACRRSRPCARARRCRSRASRASARSARSRSTALGFAALAYGALRQRPRHDADPALDGRRRAADLLRRRAPLGADRAAARRRRQPGRRRGPSSCSRSLVWPFWTLPFWLLRVRRLRARGDSRAGASRRCSVVARARCLNRARCALDRARDRGVRGAGSTALAARVAARVPGRAPGPDDEPRSRAQLAAQPAAHRLDGRRR